MAIYNGTSNSDYIAGSNENDEIYGGLGNDWLEGGAGDDIIDGGDGWNRILAGDGNDIIISTRGYIDGGNGIDTIDASGETNSVGVELTDTVGYGKVLDSADLLGNIVYGFSIRGVENVIGGAGWDYIVGNSSANELTGNGGIDNIRGGAGDDIINGNSGADYLLGEDGNDILHGGTENDNLYGGEGNDTLNGDEGDDWLMGGIGDDIFDGGEGNDMIKGNLGADYIDGGNGIDTIDYSEATKGTSVGIEIYLDGTANTDSTRYSGFSVGDIIINVENVIGSNYNDYIHCNDADNIINAGNSMDYVWGSLGADIIDGGSSSDSVNYIDSNAGVNAVLDGITSGLGGYAEGDILINIENLYGSIYDDRLIGNNYMNYIVGFEGADYIDGGDGIDRTSYQASLEGVTLYLDGTVCSGGDAEEDILVNMEIITGSMFDDIIYANTKSYNEIMGDYGNDILIGDDGDDILKGGYGSDTLTGGGGNDSFTFNNDRDSSISDGIDTITDFNPEDYLKFEDLYFGNDWTAFSVDTSTGDTIITHVTLTDFELHLTGVHTLTSNEFFFI